MRKMAVIKRIDKLDPIPGADAIEVASVGGWKVVVKKGEYQPSDLAVYCEIDSWIPHDLVPFLSKGKEPRVYEDVVGERLKTIKLRGQVSQGLLLPLYPTCNFIESLLFEGLDVSAPLNIQKWEAPIPAKLAGVMKGNFPSFLNKTDQERVQNLTEEIQYYTEQGFQFEITEKLDGSSMTVYVNGPEESGVCSRNIDLKQTEDNSFWKVAIRENLIEKLRGLTEDYGYYAIQGELIGEGVQGNKYNIKGQDFYLFDVYDIRKGEYLKPVERRAFANVLGIKHVPVLQGCGDKDLGVGDIQELLVWAEGKSLLNPKVEREGIVFKCLTNEVSFKAISNKWLIKEK